MSPRKDYYGTLGVDEKASQAEIKRAYRKLARKHHPDVNPGDAEAEERFKEISEAYHVLGNEERRKQFDRVGPEAFAQEFDLSDFADQFRTVFRTGGRGGGGAGGVGDLGFFEELLGGGGFGRAAGRPRSRRGSDVRVEVRMGLEEAMRGAQRRVSYRGSDGATRTSRVKIPAGVGDGQQIRVRGKGEPGSAGGGAGDLYLTVRIAPHPTFELDGRDLRVTVPVTVYEAGLGATVDVPTLNGSSRIRLPENTRNGQIFRLRGKGATATEERGAGDLLARVEIVLPEDPDEGTVELLQRWSDEHAYDPRSSTK